MKTIACIGGYGGGGLGRHLEEMTEEARLAGLLARYYSLGVKEGDPLGTRLDLPLLAPLTTYTPLRWTHGGKNYVGNDLFDRAVAAHLTRGETFAGFGGMSLRTFRQARRLGYTVIELEAANSHVRSVQRLHGQAFRQWGIERESWLNDAQVRKTEREYEAADTIVAASDYTRRSLMAEGIADSKIRRRILTPHPRFLPPAVRPDDGVFRVVFVGSVTVMKGVPVLLEAFSHLPGTAELTFVGGWTTRAMRRHLQERMVRDPRIRMAPGDPLPALQRADVCVHPTYEDGFAYAPIEALACGVPVVVTEDTGMKEYVREGENGFVVPTGDWQAVLERLEHLRQHPLTRGISHLPAAAV